MWTRKSTAFDKAAGQEENAGRSSIAQSRRDVIMYSAEMARCQRTYIKRRPQHSFDPRNQCQPPRNSRHQNLALLPDSTSARRHCRGLIVDGPWAVALCGSTKIGRSPISFRLSPCKSTSSPKR